MTSLQTIYHVITIDVSPQEMLGGRPPRRRWSRRAGRSEDGVLMVKSMLDLRLLDSYCPGRQEEAQEEEEEEEVQLHTKHLFFIQCSVFTFGPAHSG